MNIRKVLIGSGVAAALVAGGAATSAAIWPAAPGYAAGVVARHVQFGGDGGWRHGHARGMEAVCSDRRDRGIESGLAFVEGFINFTPEQTASWQQLADAIRAGSVTIGKKCAELAQVGEPDTAPERLARFETLAETGLGILHQIRPAFDRFYATLSDKQKSALDDLVSRHHGRRI